MEALFWCRDRTAGKATPYAVAMASNEPIDEISERARKKAKNCGERGPRLRQNAQAGEKGVGSNEEFLDRGTRITKDEQSVRTGFRFQVRP